MKYPYAALLAVLLFPLTSARADDSLADEGVRQIQALEAAFRRAVERAQPSIVSIFLVPPESGFHHFDADLMRPMRRQNPRDPDSYHFTASGFGSGIVIDKKGIVLTCYHVVRSAIQDPRRLLIMDHEGRRYGAQVYAADPRSDLAALRLRGPDKINLTPIRIADGERLFVGQFVLAVGNPHGLAAPDGMTSASWGIVSNIRRRPAVPPDFDATTSTDPPMYLYRTLVQTDARLNMGISGGALINTSGEMVGITMALAAANGLETPGGFALPTDSLTRRVIETLTGGREVEYGFLGVQPRTVTAEEAVTQHGSLPVDGVLVDRVSLFVPAYRAGLRPHDIITKINGKRITNQFDLILAVGSLPVGTVLDAEVVRGRQRLQIQIPLAKYPVDKSDIVVTNKRPTWNGIRVDHLSITAGARFFEHQQRQFTGELRPLEGGVVIREVEPGSPADKKGLREGQIITRVNGKVVDTPDDFDKEVQAVKPPVQITVDRGPPVVFDVSERKQQRTDDN